MRSLAGGAGVDLILEAGGASSFAQSMAACRVDEMAVGSLSHQEALVDFVEAHGMCPVIDRSFALSEID